MAAEIEFVLMASNNTTVITSLDLVLDGPEGVVLPRWQELVDGAQPGSGAWSMRLADSTQWAAVTYDKFIQCKLRGVTQFALKPRRRPSHCIQRTGVGLVEFEADGILQVLADAVVELAPLTKSWAKTTGKRRWSWAGSNFNDSSWSAHSVLGAIYDPLPPKGYLSPFSQKATLSGAGPSDTIFARRTFTVTTPIVLVPRVTGAGNCKWSLNDVPLGETNTAPSKSDENTWTTAITITDAGTYVLAVECTGNDSEIWFGCEAYGPADYETGRLTTGSFLFQTGYQVGHSGDPAYYEPWKLLKFNGTTRPAQTPGDVLLDLIVEAQARGELTGVTASFTRTLDSNGNAWEPLSGDFVCDTLRTVLETAQQLAASEADIWMNPSGLVVNAVNWRTRGDFWTTPASPPIFSGAAYGVSGGRNPNLTELTWTETLAPSAIKRVFRSKTAYGTVGTGPERGIDLSDVDATTAATIVAALNTARDDELDTWTILTKPSNGDDKFYDDIALGDAIKVPTGATGATSVAQRTMSYTVSMLDGSRTQANVIAEVAGVAAEFNSLTTRKVTRLRAGGSSDAISAPTDFGAGVEWKQVEEVELAHLSTYGVDLADLADLLSNPEPYTATRMRASRHVTTMSNEPLADVHVDLEIDGVAIHTIVIETGAARVLDADSYIGDAGSNAAQHPALMRGRITTDPVVTAGGQMDIHVYGIPAVA